MESVSCRSNHSLLDEKLADCVRHPSVVAEQILDRIPTTVKPWSAVFNMLGKEETIVLILNAYARQSIWRECLAVISDIRKTEDPRFGTTTSVPLTPSYVSKIGLLAKLVEGKLSPSNLTHSCSN